MSTQPLTAHVGRHASVADWRSTVNKRMQAAADKQTQTFLQDLLDQLAESGVQRVRHTYRLCLLSIKQSVLCNYGSIDVAHLQIDQGAASYRTLSHALAAYTG